MAVQVITTEEFTPVLRRLEILEKDNALLKRLAKKDLSTAEAMEVVKLSRRGLEDERARPNTLIRHAKQGRKVTYELQSLLDYLEAKRIPSRKFHLKVA